MSTKSEMISIIIWADKKDLDIFMPNSFLVKKMSVKKIFKHINKLVDTYFKDCQIAEIKIQTSLAIEREKEWRYKGSA